MKYKEEFFKCKKPDCQRKVPRGTDYCCAPCRVAARGGYEIHETGPLAHSAGCQIRWKERKALK